MKKIYNIQTFLNVPNYSKRFEPVSVWDSLQLIEETEVSPSFTEVFNTFEDLYTAVQNGEIHNAVVGKTFFRNVLTVELSILGSMSGITIRQDEKNFKPIRMRITTTPYNTSLKRLQDELSADDFIEYCVTRGYLF